MEAEKLTIKPENSRPGRFDKAVFKSAEIDIHTLVRDCDFSSELSEEDWPDIFKCISGAYHDDGYKLMRRLEDDCNVEGCFADADQLDGVSEILRQHHDKVVQEWVKANNITVPYTVGQTVTFKHGGETLTGKITHIALDVAKVHVLVDGRRGKPIVPVEDIKQ
jgi:hypothetical protein